MFFLIIGKFILIAIFIVGCLLTVRHPSRKWIITGRLFIFAGISVSLGWYMWDRVPLDIYLITTLAGGFAWQDIIYTNILVPQRRKYFPHDCGEENKVAMLA